MRVKWKKIIGPTLAILGLVGIFSLASPGPEVTLRDVWAFVSVAIFVVGWEMDHWDER